MLLLTSPLGKKSRPTIDSSTEDLPELCDPSTAILGKLMYCCRPTSLNSSYKNQSLGINSRTPGDVSSYDNIDKLSQLLKELTSLIFALFSFLSY
jgi:hypothetical protein